ncbi:MAG: hypothetical protein LIO45_06200, partial [Clostridiales bacterium]|nr:hypothetical protein [Clostridiales bacterium]
ILDDGLFEVVLIRAPKNLLDLNQVAAALLSRQPNEYIASIQSNSVCFQSEEPVSWTLDGEFGGEHRELTIENLPRYVTILSGKQQGGEADENAPV